jgi:hypothetical protein
VSEGLPTPLPRPSVQSFAGGGTVSLPPLYADRVSTSTLATVSASPVSQQPSKFSTCLSFLSFPFLSFPFLCNCPELVLVKHAIDAWPEHLINMRINTLAASGQPSGAHLAAASSRQRSCLYPSCGCRRPHRPAGATAAAARPAAATAAPAT